MTARAMIIVLFVLAAPLLAQDADGQARRIVEQPPYQGYRVERARPAEESTRGFEGDTRQGESGTDGAGGESTNPYRRGGRASGRTRPQSRESGQSDGPGSGPDFSGLSWIGPVFEVIVWIFVIAGALAGLYFLIKALMGLKFQRRKKAEKGKAKRKKAETKEAAPDAPAAPDIPEEVFEDALQLAMKEYDQALKAQEWGRAALIAYRIFWLRAGWQGCVESTDVRTWRDALRLMRSVEQRQQVRELLRLVERVRYGEHAPDGAEFQQWRTGLDALDPREALK